MPSEIQKFQNDLLESVKQMRRGQAARVTKGKLPEAAQRTFRQPPLPLMRSPASGLSAIQLMNSTRSASGRSTAWLRSYERKPPAESRSCYN